MSKIITGKVRFSYANVFEPRAMTDGGTLKYSVSLIISKDDEGTIKKIKKAIAQAMEDGKSKLADKGGKINKSALKLPLRDGDEERDDEVYENSLFVNANNTKRPGLVDENVQAIIDPDEFYSGCYGRASINFYAFNSNGNKGIACGLNNLQKLEDGDRLDGSSSAESDFGEDNEDLM